MKIASKVYSDGALIILTWPKPIGYIVEENGSDLLIRFDRALGDVPVDGITSDLKTWINGASTGYDTLFLQGRRGVSFAVAMDGAQLYIDVAATPARKPATGSKADADADADQGTPPRLRLALLEARILLANGEQESALRLLEKEMRRHPDNPRVMAAMAELENQAGRWRKALALYDRALIVHSRDEDILLARGSILRDRAPYLNLEAEHLRIGDKQRQNTARLSGQHSVTEELSLGFSHEVRHTKANDLRRADGRILDFKGTRQRGELYAVLEPMDGHRVRGALLAGEKTLGGGAAYAITDLRGETQLAGEFNRPSWDFAEGFADQGVRHQIGALREHRFSPRLSGQAAAFARIYGIDGDSNVASSLAFEGGLQYLVVSGSPSLSVGYLFDAEYRRSIEERRDGSGAAFNPIPLVSSEIHALETSVAYDLTDDWRASAFAGYGIDRFAAGDFFAGIGLVHEGDGPLRGRLFAERGLSAVDTSDSAVRLGFSLMWRF